MAKGRELLSIITTEPCSHGFIRGGALHQTTTAKALATWDIEILNILSFRWSVFLDYVRMPDKIPA